jgi:hypothetical protein
MILLTFIVVPGAILTIIGVYRLSAKKSYYATFLLAGWGLMCGPFGWLLCLLCSPGVSEWARRRAVLHTLLQPAAGTVAEDTMAELGGLRPAPAHDSQEA